MIVQGCLLPNGLFQVDVMGFPPAEDRFTSLTSMGITDVYGRGWRPQHLLSLQEMEIASTQTMMIILSDVQLDHPFVLEKFKEILEGFDEEGHDGEGEIEREEREKRMSQIIFILIGNFITKAMNGSEGRGHGKSMFQALGDIISAYPSLANHAKFVLVPGISYPSY